MLEAVSGSNKSRDMCQLNIAEAGQVSSKCACAAFASDARVD